MQEQSLRGKFEFQRRQFCTNCCVFVMMVKIVRFCLKLVPISEIFLKLLTRMCPRIPKSLNQTTALIVSVLELHQITRSYEYLSVSLSMKTSKNSFEEIK